MKKTIYFQLTFSGALLLFLLGGLLSYPHVIENWYKTGAVGTYFGLSILALNGKLRLSWAFLIFVPLYFVASIIPMAVYNFYEFYLGNEIFKDSPGTLLVVAIYLAVLGAPSLILCISYAINYKYFENLFVPRS